MAQIFRTDSHDTVVAKYADLIHKNNPDAYRVLAAGSDGKPAKVGGVTPDILLKDATGKNNILAIEVETAATLARPQVKERWQPMANSGTPLEIVIPKGTLARVKRLCKAAGIKAKFYEF